MVLMFKMKEKEKNDNTPIIYDFRRDVVKLPNGDVVPRKNILHVDPKENIIVYIGSDMEIKKVKF